MSQAATLYHFTIDLADMDRSVFETLVLRVARHPSETAEHMVVRVLAYCVEYEDGLEFAGGLSSGDEPALWVRDLTGRLMAWIEVGLPDASRLHRASKHAGRVAVYSHRDARQWMDQLAGERIHRSGDIAIRLFDRRAIEDLAAALERRTSLAVSISGQELHVAMDARTVTIPMVELRLA